MVRSSLALAALILSCLAPTEVTVGPSPTAQAVPTGLTSPVGRPAVASTSTPTSSPTVAAPPVVTGHKASAMGQLTGDMLWMLRTYVTGPETSQTQHFELWGTRPDGKEPKLAVWWERPVPIAAPSLPPLNVARQLSPDGRRFLLLARSGDARRLTAVELSTGRFTVLTTDAGYSDESAAWSADGSKIAIRRTAGGLEAGLWVLNADGTGLRELRTGIDRQRIGTGAVYGWSPDGAAIAYDEPLGQYRVVSATDGTLITVAGQEVTSDAPASWRARSPRLAIAYTVRGALGVSVLSATDITRPPPHVGGRQEPSDAAVFSDPRWHPERDEILYVRTDLASPLRPLVTLHSVTLDGRVRDFPTNGAPRSPQWLPDGHEVVFLGGETSTSPFNIGVFVTSEAGLRGMPALPAVAAGARDVTLLDLAPFRYR